MRKLSSASFIAPAETGVCRDGERRFSQPLTPTHIKRGFDIGVAALAILCFVPLLAAIALILLATQGRPILIRHKRVGRGGNMFPCLKFRTMVINADEVLQSHLALNPEASAEWDATRKLKNDPRVTPLGHMLRKSSVDELPQLFNVLRGEMSLVGPRPIVPAEIQNYGIHIQQYERVRPGLTGLWQVGGRNDVSYSKRVQMDCEYVANWCFTQDLAILVQTIPAVLQSKGSY